MSDEVAVTTSEAPAEIIPAKSEDKLEIEKEEAEQKEAEENKDTEPKESVEGQFLLKILSRNIFKKQK